MTLNDFNPSEDWDPTEAIMRNLAAKEQGNFVDKVEVEAATYILGALSLMSKGIDEETAIKIIDQASERGTIHVEWTEKDGLEVTIQRGDD